MNHEQPSQKHQTIQIKLPPKPAAPRHPQIVARAVPLQNIVPQSQRKHSCFLFPLVQMAAASVLAMMVLDMGECSHIVAYAALGYGGGLALMVPRRDALTQTDEFLIRWGFPMLCVLSGVLAAVIWPLRM